MTAVSTPITRTTDSVPPWIEALATRIAAELDGAVALSLVAEVVHDELAALGHAPVSDFVPVFVERRTRRRVATRS